LLAEPTLGQCQGYWTGNLSGRHHQAI